MADASTPSGSLSSPLMATAYTELCSSYRYIDDFRSKLLGLLPAATGAAILFTSKEGYGQLLEGLSKPIAVFGFLITGGLFCYEIYGIRKCAELIRAGREMEIAQNVHGQFRSRPQAVRGWINEPLAAGVIYPVVLASWLVVFFWPPLCRQAEPAIWMGAALLALIGFVGVRKYDLSLGKQECDACGCPLGDERGLRPGRVASSSSPPDYWFCSKCCEGLRQWIEERRPARYGVDASNQ